MAVCEADRRLFLTRGKERVVEQGDPEAAWLFCAVGQELSEADLEAYRLEVRDGKVVLPATNPAKAREKTEDKAAAKEEDKSANKTEWKSPKKS